MTETLARVRELAPTIRAAAADTRANRRVGTEVVAALKAAGVFRMPMPAAWGGPELTPLEQLEVFEELSHADGSVGWVSMIGCDAGYYGAFLDDDVARSIWPDLDMVTAGMTGPAAKAVRDGDGWRVSGRWSFGSGSTHADVFVGGAFLEGEPPGPDGVPAWRTFVLPTADVEVHDTWYTIGLEGTASNDYSVAEAFVPDEHTFDVLVPSHRREPLYRLPWWFAVKVVGVPLGLGRRALDETAALAATKLVMPDLVFLRDRPATHAGLAQAEAMVASARAYVVEAIGAVWEACVADVEPSARETAALRLAITNAAFRCRDAIQLCCDLVTTTSIPAASALGQALRDAQVVCQHLIANGRTYEQIGRRLLGVGPVGPFI
jgi:alkylation response protein AidB-like acyl-CoA dehydrogenase